MASVAATTGAPALVPPEGRQVFLSTVPSGRNHNGLALAVVLVSSAIFVAAAPFAKTPLPPVPAFLPAYQSALVLNDLITAILLFGQFRILRQRALLVLASAYLFSALMAVFHALSFPGLFAPAGLLGGGGQTTAWLYFLWHGGFPLGVIAYALLKNKREADGRLAGSVHGSARAAILGAAGATLAVACGLTLLATAGHDYFPVIMQSNQDAPAKVLVATATWMVTLIALPMLWRQRPHSVVDLWLMVVMCAWVFDIALASVLNGARYDLGWYGGRLYGLLAASFVLAVLLLENSMLHARLVEAREVERQRTQEALSRHGERLRILHEIDRAIVAGMAPDVIATAVIQPLRDLLEVPRVIVNIFDLETGTVEWLAAAGRHRTHAGPPVRFPIQLMGDVESLKRGEPQVIDTRALPPGPEADALLASGVHVYMVVPMISGNALMGALSFGGEQRSFPPEQVAIAREVATQLAIAISQAGLLARVVRQADELEQRVRERTVELQVANQELESFSYSVSHDLRSPLRAVDGFAQILEEDHANQLDAEGRRLLGVVREEAGRMGRLIDDLLRFSHVGRRAVMHAPVDMRSLAGEVIAELSPAHPRARIVLADLPKACGDQALLRQVWANLIANALKYSSQRESPRVELGGQADGEDNVYWVRDNGAGFDMRYHEKLFKVFQRLHREEEFEGTGVGLAIVQRVVARHGGRVWAESVMGEGAKFHFTIPKRA